MFITKKEFEKAIKKAVKKARKKWEMRQYRDKRMTEFENMVWKHISEVERRMNKLARENEQVDEKEGMRNNGCE